jgi:hypothetical protein
MIFNRDKDARLERRRQALERIDKRGRLHYVLTTGVLGWGGFMFVIMTCIDIFVDHYRILSTILVGLVVWPLAGFGFGLWMWRSSEKQFDGPPNKPPSIIGN